MGNSQTVISYVMQIKFINFNLSSYLIANRIIKDIIIKDKPDNLTLK